MGEAAKKARQAEATPKKRTARPDAGVKKAPAKRAAAGKAKAASKKATAAKAGTASKMTTSKAGTASKKATTAKAKSTPKKAAAKKPAASKAAATRKKTGAKSPAKKNRRTGVEENPVATARGTRKSAEARTARRARSVESRPDRPRKRKGKGGAQPPRKGPAWLAAVNVCLIAGIAVLVALGARQQRSYAEFVDMRSVVDRQTFYEGTTVEGVDVSRMTLSDALTYWSERVEPRYMNRTVTLDDGETVTSGKLGYESDYESVLTAAWSAGRSGGLEERYRMVTARQAHPVAFSVTRRDYDGDTLDEYVRGVADAVNQKAVDASIESFNAETYEFTFKEAQEGKKLDEDALKKDIVGAIAAGGGNVALSVETVQPSFSTEEVASQYGLIDYAITNASTSSSARLKNIKLALSIINGTRVGPGETFSFNDVVGQRTYARGFRKATAYSGGDVTEQVGGGICQVSTTLFNAAVKADMEIIERHNHSLTVSYVDKGKDATVDWGHQDLRFKNNSPDDVYICCYLTDDERVRFGIFGLLLPNGEKITLDAVTTEVTKYDTRYEATPLLASGETTVQQKGKNGYRAEAYKVRWDAEGNELSRELLCKSYYRMKTEVVLYGP